MPVRQILSSSQLLDFGCYDYFEVSLQEAIQWLSQGEYFCTIRSRDMCYALHELTGRNFYPLAGIPTPPLRPGDEALVYYVTLSETVRSIPQMTREHMMTNYTLGFLKRVDVVAPPVVEEKTAVETSVDIPVQQEA